MYPKGIVNGAFAKNFGGKLLGAPKGVAALEGAAMNAVLHAVVPAEVAAAKKAYGMLEKKEKHM